MPSCKVQCYVSERQLSLLSYPCTSLPLSSQQSTIFTGSDVAALPVCRPWPPGAVVLHHGPVGADVHAVHTPRLEAVVSARSRADGPQAHPPVHTTDISPAVLGAQGPVGRRERGAEGQQTLHIPLRALYGSDVQKVPGEASSFELLSRTKPSAFGIPTPG